MLLAGGSDEADRILRDKLIVTEEMIHTFPEDVPNGIIEAQIGDLNRFRKYFDEDAWTMVSDIGINLTDAKFSLLVTQNFLS
jgi:hypothetical protein